MMHQAEQNNAITNNQWGGRKRRQCSDLSLQNELHVAIHSLTRHDGAVTDVDASSCFDRIPPSLMYLGYCKAGLCPQAMTLLSKALLKHEYLPVTGHGVSDTANTHSQEHPFNGPGQGSSDGTNAWGVVYDKLDRV